MPNPSMIAMWEEEEQAEKSLMEQWVEEDLLVGGGNPNKPYFYLAGPMTNIPAFNFPAFDEAAGKLRAQGYNVINPAELDHELERKEAESSPDGKHAGLGTVKTWKQCLRRDIPIVLDENCVGLFVLPGWETSSGAQFETYVAAKLEVPLYAFDGTTLIQIDRRAALKAAGVDD